MSSKLVVHAKSHTLNKKVLAVEHAGILYMKLNIMDRIEVSMLRGMEIWNNVHLAEPNSRKKELL